MRFDLTSQESLSAVKVDKVRRWAGAICVVVFAFILVAAPVYYYLGHLGFSGWMPAQTVALGFVAFLSGAGALVYRGAAPPATSVEVTSDELVFELRNQPTWRVAWSDTNLSLRLFRTDGTARRGVGAPPTIVAVGPHSTSIYLTREAFDAIVHQARTKGLRVVDLPGSRPGWTRTVIGRG